MKLFSSIVARCRLILLAFVISSTPLSAQENKMNDPLHDYILGVTRLVHTQWPLMYKIWPELNYRNINLLLVSINHGNNIPLYWLININGWRQVSADEVGKFIPPNVENFSFRKILGRDGIVITIDSKKLPQSQDAIFRLATHELVHYLFQKAVHLDTEAENRDTPYPLDYRPRLYRFMTIRSLQQAVHNPKQTIYLCHAKYWFDKWRNEFGNEYRRIKTTDIVEGSASYIEMMSVVVEKNKNLAQLRETLLPEFRITPDAVLSLDDESYLLGAAAGVLLDSHRPAWKKTFYRDNVTPAELLLNGVKDCQMSFVTSSFENVIRLKVAQENERLAKLFVTIDRAISNPDIPWLRLESSYQQGSMSNEGFYRLKNRSVILRMTAKYRGKAGYVTVDKFSAIDDGQSVLIPISPAASVDNGLLTLNTPRLEGALRVKAHRDADGRLVYQVREE